MLIGNIYLSKTVSLNNNISEAEFTSVNTENTSIQHFCSDHPTKRKKIIANNFTKTFIDKL